MRASSSASGSPGAQLLQQQRHALVPAQLAGAACGEARLATTRDQAIGIDRFREMGLVPGAERAAPVLRRGVPGHRRGGKLLRMAARHRPDGTDQRVAVAALHADVGHAGPTATTTRASRAPPSCWRPTSPPRPRRRAAQPGSRARRGRHRRRARARPAGAAAASASSRGQSVASRSFHRDASASIPAAGVPGCIRRRSPAAERG